MFASFILIERLVKSKPPIITPINGINISLTKLVTIFEKAVPIPEGNSIIEVTVYNLNGLTVNKKAKVNNFQR